MTLTCKDYGVLWGYSHRFGSDLGEFIHSIVVIYIQTSLWIGLSESNVCCFWEPRGSSSLSCVFTKMILLRSQKETGLPTLLTKYHSAPGCSTTVCHPILLIHIPPLPPTYNYTNRAIIIRKGFIFIWPRLLKNIIVFAFASQTQI